MGKTFAVAFVLVGTLSACGPQTFNADFSKTYAFKVNKETTSIALRMASDDGTLSANNAARLRAFVLDYYRRAQSPMLIFTAPGSGLAPEAKANAVRMELLDAGMREGDVVMRPGKSANGGKDVVILSFRAYVAEVPECGDWSTETGFNPGNLPHGNFGCSYQRNIGLMVSNPKDLITSQPEDTLDPTKRTTVIDIYRTGETTGSDVSAEETTGLE